VTARIAAIFRAIPYPRIRAVIRDGITIGGFALADYGIWIIHKPAAIIFGGIVIAALSILSAPEEPIEPNN